MTRLLAALLLAGLTGAVHAAEAPIHLGLEEALELALANNETVLKAEQDRIMAEGAVIEARAGALPQISLQGSYQGNFMRPAFFAPEEFGGGIIEMGSDIEVTGILRMDQVLFAFGRVGKALEFARIYQDIAESGIRMAHDQVVFECREAYLRVQLLEEVLAIARKTQEQLQAQRNLVEAKLEEGTASRFELLRGEVELKNHLPVLIRAESGLELARDDLLRILGLPPGSEILLSDPTGRPMAHFDEEEALREALGSRPEIRALELRVDGAEKILAIRKAGRLPILGLYGQMMLQGASDRHHPLAPFDSEHSALSSSAGLAIQLPIFDGFRTRGQVQQAEANLRRSRYELEQVSRGLRLELSQALQEFRSLSKELESMEATVGLAEEAYEIARTRYDEGLSIQLELDDARMALELARTGLAETLYRYNVALARLDRVLGRSYPAESASAKE